MPQVWARYFSQSGLWKSSPFIQYRKLYMSLHKVITEIYKAWEIVYLQQLADKTFYLCKLMC